MTDQQYTGFVKSFNTNNPNGYGFIECPETQSLYNGDVFLHRHEFINGNCAVGMQVSFNISLSDRGQPRAYNVQGMGEAPMNAVTGQMLAQNDMNGGGMMMMGQNQFKRGHSGMNRGGGQMMNGQIKQFNQDKGFGFIDCPDLGCDVFLHFTEAINFRVGDCVTFCCGQDNQTGKYRASGLSLMQNMGGGMQGGMGMTGGNDGGYGGMSNQGGGMQQGMGGGQGNWGGGGQQWGGQQQQWGGGGNWGKGGGKGMQMSQVEWNLPFPPHKEFWGYVKNYLEDKGFGFIYCDATMNYFGKDVFLSKDEVEPHGLKVNDEVLFRIVLNKKSQPQAQIVGKPAELMQEGQQKLEAIGDGPHHGVIKNYNEGKGFGFIECAEAYNVFGHDVFMHKAEMGAVITAGAGVGAEVAFHLQINNKGKPQAVHVLPSGQPSTKRKHEDEVAAPAWQFDTSNVPVPQKPDTEEA